MSCESPGPFGPIDIDDPNGVGIRSPSRPSATVRAGGWLDLARCSASDADNLACAQQVHDPGYRRLRIQQRHASIPGPDLHSRHHQRRYRSRIGVAQVRRVDGQLHRLPEIWAVSALSSRVPEVTSASPVKTRTGPDVPVATDTSSKLTAILSK